MQEKGLTAEEVRQRAASGQINNVEDRQSRGYLEILAKNLLTPFNIILFILGIALYIVDGPINAIATVGVILFNVIISTAQEFKAKRRLDKIALLMRPKVTVIRDGEEQVIDRSEVVIDDIVHMKSGDQAQVDGIVLEEKSVEMDESLLTGESSTQRKHVDDRIYSGSYCVTGDCWFRVDKVGYDTFSSKMLATARKFHKKKTPLQTETNIVTEMLMIIAFIFLVLLVVTEIIVGVDLKDCLREAAIILDIVPIALFLLITLTYMIAAVRMADSGVLLQNSSSVESMSHVDTVCMDKTGTITTNNLVYNDTHYYEDQELVDTMIRCFVSTTGSRNRTVTAMEAHFGNADAELLDEVQFSSDRKFSAVKVRYNGEVHTVVMGAWPFLKEKVSDHKDVEAKLKELSSRGLRSVVFFDAGSADLHSGEEVVLPDLTLMAVISIMDEVRPDCREILMKFIDNGMDIKVISGDDPETVDAIFSIAEIPGERKIISGDKLASLPEKEYTQAVLETNIFGRMRPEQKEKVVETLRREGRYVAMVGDGINDVRSIKKAQVGVAVQSGSGAARGVADMVLANDNFMALPQAIVEGKRTVSGMRDILRLYLSRNFVLAFLVFVILLLGRNMPLMPVQNTVYALMTVSVSAFMLTLWARPSDNKDMILPNVLRYVLPFASVTGVFALIVYIIFYLQIFDVDGMLGMYNDLAVRLGYSDYDDMASSLDLGSEYREVVARSAMLAFLLLSGIAQLFILFPPVKRLNLDDPDKDADRKPLVLMVLLLGLMFAFYYIPEVSVKIGLTLPLTTAGWAVIIVMFFVWAAVMILSLKAKFLRKLNEWGNEIVLRYFIRLFEKENAKEAKAISDEENDQ